MRFIDVLELALRAVDPDQVNHPWLSLQERVVAYEVYHQIRKMEEERRVSFGPARLQAEVNKFSQHYFHHYFLALYEAQGLPLDFDVSEAMPDLLLHVPGSEVNLAVVEVKREKGFSAEDVEWDLAKLALFSGPHLHYEERIFVMALEAGNDPERAFEHIRALGTADGPAIDVLLADVSTRTVTRKAMAHSMEKAEAVLRRLSDEKRKRREAAARARAELAKQASGGAANGG
jgi:hypothetical protein